MRSGHWRTVPLTISRRRREWCLMIWGGGYLINNGINGKRSGPTLAVHQWWEGGFFFFTGQFISGGWKYPQLDAGFDFRGRWVRVWCELTDGHGWSVKRFSLYLSDWSFGYKFFQLAKMKENDSEGEVGGIGPISEYHFPFLVAMRSN